MASLIPKIDNYNDLMSLTANSVNIHNGEITLKISDMLNEDLVSRDVSPVTNISVTKNSCKDSYADDIIIITVYINISAIPNNDVLGYINYYNNMYAKVVQGLENTRVLVVPSKTDRDPEVRVVSRRSDYVEDKTDGNTIEDNHKDNKKTKKRV